MMREGQRHNKKEINLATAGARTTVRLIVYTYLFVSWTYTNTHHKLSVIMGRSNIWNTVTSSRRLSKSGFERNELEAPVKSA
jgi:hypothetical protein